MMHSSKRMCFVIWKDKQPLLLLSTYAPPIPIGDPMTCTVLRRNGGDRPQIPTSSIFVDYTTQMRCGGPTLRQLLLAFKIT